MGLVVMAWRGRYWGLLPERCGLPIENWNGDMGWSALRSEFVARLHVILKQIRALKNTLHA